MSTQKDLRPEAIEAIRSVQLKLILRPAQARQLERWLWHLTGVHNWAVKKLQADAANGIYWSCYDFMALMNGHSQRMGIPAVVLRGTASTAHDAWKRSFKKLTRRPRLRGHRNTLNSILFRDGATIRASRATVAGLKRLRFHVQAVPAGHIGYARIVRRASGWYLCLFVKAERPPIARVADGQIGIDPGFHRLLTTSAGEIVEHPDELRAGEHRLGQARRGQRKHLAAKLLERQANQRRDRNHKLSRRLVAENRLIAWSKDRSAGLARVFGKSVTSAGHHQLRAMLAYKSRSGGTEFVEVASRNSTRVCSACRAPSGPTGFSGLKVRQWTCGACGAQHERDVNAARNTLLAARGMRVECGREAASGIAS